MVAYLFHELRNLAAGVKRTSAGGSLVAPFTKLPLWLLYFFTTNLT